MNTVAESIELGKEAADYISRTFLHPIKLEFEKVLLFLKVVSKNIKLLSFAFLGGSHFKP